MGRSKNFTREEVLEKAIPVFWTHGFADTGLAALEEATGVNKSGLYTEFRSKEGLFLACLQHYLEKRRSKTILRTEPLGWNNIESFLNIAIACTGGRIGCLATYSMREFAILPPEAHEMIYASKTELKRLISDNVRAEKTEHDPVVAAELISTFFSGLVMEQSLKAAPAAAEKKIQSFMRMLRS